MGARSGLCRRRQVAAHWAGHGAFEVGPAFAAEVVQLAVLGGLEVPLPREGLHDDAAGQHFFELGLRLLEAVQRDAHVHMVRGVLHDVVHHGADLERKGQVHGGRHKGRGLGPGGLVVVPGHFDVGVVHVDHEADHAVPEEEGHGKAQQQRQPDRLAGVHRSRCDGSDPESGKQAHQHAVLEEDRAAGGHVGLVGEELALPPDFDHVVQTGCPAAAVGAFQQLLQG